MARGESLEQILERGGTHDEKGARRGYPNTERPMSTQTKIQRRANYAVLGASAFVMIVCLFGHLGAVGLVGPDEPRYAWIARAMATTGDWVTPRLYGQPWFEKPVLYYWLAGAGFLMHLPAEWAARLPSAFAALAAAITLGWLVWKNYGAAPERFASPWFIAPPVFSTSVAAIGFARAAGPDMLFSAALTLAMASAAAVLRRRGALRSAGSDALRGATTDYLALALFGAWLGFAVLAKGPAGVLIAAGAIGIWALATKRWRAALRLAHPVAIAAFCIVTLPWYVFCATRNPDFIHIFIFQHNFERYLTPMFQHRQPFWYFVPILILGLLPWTACLWVAARKGLRLWREKSWSDSPGFFFACWAVFPFLFFSFSQSKLPGYILPAIPPLALMIAIGFRRAAPSPTVPEPQKTSARWINFTIGTTLIVLALSAVLWMKRLPPGVREVSGRAILLGVIVAIVGGIGITVMGLLRMPSGVVLTFFVMALLVEITGAGVLPGLDPYISARFHGNLLRNDRYPNRVFTFRLQRSWGYGLNFYLEREIAEWSAADLGPALVLTTPQGLEEIKRLGRFQGSLDEPYVGILYVPVLPASH
jgi:4-amino-4-deoxy-L-arabinose transferase-like glycosyltransferase